MQYWCNLTTKERGVECTCVINDDFTVLVSGGGRCHWVSMCTVGLSHSKWLSEYSDEFASNFALSLNIQMTQEATAMGNWWLAASSWQSARLCIRSPEQFFCETSNHSGDPAPLQPRFGALQLLAFPKTKITVEREEISYYWWDSGKYNRAADGDWENCVKSQGAYFEGDWGIIVLCTMFLVSVFSLINISIFHITWLDTFWTELGCL